MTLFQAVEAATKPCVGRVCCLNHATVESLVHPMIKIRVLILVFVVVPLFWLGPQVHWLRGIAVIFLLHLDRSDVEPADPMVHWPIRLPGSGLAIRARSCIGRVSHASLSIILLILL